MASKVKPSPNYRVEIAPAVAARPTEQRVNNIAVVIDTFSYTSRGRASKPIYDQFFSCLVDAGVGTIVRFDKHLLNSRQRHVLFKQALRTRAEKAGLDVHIGGLRVAPDQYYLEAQLLIKKD